jgi:hypothetical protein
MAMDGFFISLPGPLHRSALDAPRSTVRLVASGNITVGVAGHTFAGRILVILDA